MFSQDNEGDVTMAQSCVHGTTRSMGAPVYGTYVTDGYGDYVGLITKSGDDERGDGTETSRTTGRESSSYRSRINATIKKSPGANGLPMLPPPGIVLRTMKSTAAEVLRRCAEEGVEQITAEWASTGMLGKDLSKLTTGVRREGPEVQVMVQNGAPWLFTVEVAT